jgi:hypothetical protein
MKTDIVGAKVIDKLMMLVKFQDGKNVIYDFSKYENEFWLKRNLENFDSFSIEHGDIVWGKEEDGIPSREIYQDGIDFAKVIAAA